MKKPIFLLSWIVGLGLIASRVPLNRGSRLILLLEPVPGSSSHAEGRRLSGRDDLDNPGTAE